MLALVERVREGLDVIVVVWGGDREVLSVAEGLDVRVEAIDWEGVTEGLGELEPPANWAPRGKKVEPELYTPPLLVQSAPFKHWPLQVEFVRPEESPKYPFGQL